jgi:methionine-rich copper-binding protein CopC
VTRVWATGLAAGVLFLLGLLSFPSPALAHASLLASTPEQGEVLDALPAQVALEFTEDLAQPAYVIVRSPDGVPVTVGAPEVSGAVVTQDLVRDGLLGTYSIAYRVVSEDGHPLTGEVLFSVGEPAARPPGSASETASGSEAPPEPVDETGSATSAPRAVVDRGSRRLDVAVPAGLFGLALVLLALSRRKETSCPVSRR